MKLYIDNREPKQIISLIQNLNNNSNKQFEIIVTSLDLGDYIIEKNDEKVIIFERKSLADLESSIKDGRYDEQSYRLSNFSIHNHNIIYLIEGSTLNYRNKSFIPSLYSSYLTLNYFKGFSIMNSINLVESAEIIFRFTNKLLRENEKIGYYSQHYSQHYSNNEGSNNEGSNNEYLNKDNNINYESVIKSTKKSNITKENINTIMLMQIPNISNVSANAILEQFGNIKNLILKLEEDPNCLNMIKVKNNRKLGKNIIESIKEFLLI